MAICGTCGQEMRTAASCTLEVIEYADGVTLPRLRWGDDEGERCGDCGVEPGGFHHLNCDQEICPRCKQQLIGACDCPLSPACPNDEAMAAGDLLRQYVELAKWELDVANPAGILTDTERYPEPWRQRREFFDSHWQDGDAAEVTRGGQVTQDESLGWCIAAVETDAGIIITDDCNGDGYFRIAKRPKIDRAERLVTMLAGGLRPGECLEVHSRGNHLGRIKVTTASEFMAEWGNAVAYPWHDTSLANDPHTKGRFLGIVYEEGSTLIRLDVPSDWSGFTSAKASRQRLGAARHRCLAATER